MVSETPGDLVKARDYVKNNMVQLAASSYRTHLLAYPLDIEARSEYVGLLREKFPVKTKDRIFFRVDSRYGLENVLREADEAIEQNPRDPIVFSVTGESARKSGDHTIALYYLGEALNLVKQIKIKPIRKIVEKKVVSGLIDSLTKTEKYDVALNLLANYSKLFNKEYVIRLQRDIDAEKHAAFLRGKTSLETERNPGESQRLTVEQARVIAKKLS